MAQLKLKSKPSLKDINDNLFEANERYVREIEKNTTDNKQKTSNSNSFKFKDS